MGAKSTTISLLWQPHPRLGNPLGITFSPIRSVKCTSCSVKAEIQKEHSCIPVLNMIYDGLQQTNAKMRIEAFIHQAKLYAERYCAVRS